MTNSNDFYQDDLDDLLNQVDDLLKEPQPEPEEEPDSEFDDFDVDDYTPQDDYDDAPMVYQNYSNRYGADLRNYSNGYGTGVRQEPPQRPAQSAIPAYNGDAYRRGSRQESRREPKREPTRQPNPYQEPTRRAKPCQEPEHEIYLDNGAEALPPVKQKQKKQPEPKRKGYMGCMGCGCSTLLVFAGLMALAVVLVFNFIFAPPKSDASIGARKRDTATVLICGTDKDGTRTDTMMLMYLSGSEHKVGLLSLPRDSLTITSGGSYAKLNSAYGRNGTGEEGMEGLLDYVQEIIGYRPDGYILLDMDLVPQIVDAMGGLDVEVPVAFDMDGIHLDEGMQHLAGSQVLCLLRFRSGYAMQDLGRVEVQRAVISAALDQWVSLAHVKDVSTALKLVENYSTTTLNVRNYLWMAKTVLFSRGGISTDTLPGTADYIDGVSYYILDRQDIADLINQDYNPYRVTISPDSLNIAG